MLDMTTGIMEIIYMLTTAISWILTCIQLVNLIKFNCFIKSIRTIEFNYNRFIISPYMVISFMHSVINIIIG